MITTQDVFINKSLPFISVIIPYKASGDDHRALEKCVAGLLVQSYPSDKFETIVVSNSDADSDEFYSVYQRFRQVQVIHEPELGSYAARNTGVRASQGEVLAFTDSDCVPEPDWLANAAKHIIKGHKRVAGRIILSFLNSRRLTVAERYEKAFAFRQKQNVSLGEAVTANLIVTRSVFYQVGFFRHVTSGEDYEWNRRATVQGIALSYGENVAVTHPARSFISELLNKHQRTTVGADRSAISYIKRMMPPVRACIALLSRSDLTVFDKCVSLSILYGLKLRRNFLLLFCQSKNI